MVFNRLDEDKDGEMTVGSRGAVLDSGGVIDVGAVLIKEGSGDCDAVLVDEGGDGMAPFDGEEAGGKVMSNESSGSGSVRKTLSGLCGFATFAWLAILGFQLVLPNAKRSEENFDRSTARVEVFIDTLHLLKFPLISDRGKIELDG
ncbi:uncharacterized protein MEPE_01869 [Melanopsichium pennsylvanicum]|uniref:Uncharacterized protein n=1 Tax=Melanopsichium pennsylvanicum TaxID=63383 RepID=A0AAJ4XJA2_9BASI|nr:uncharacterized protein MEPE_01869 [Melanopsichium pennsylvanicum]